MTDSAISTLQTLFGSELLFYILVFIAIIGALFFFRASKEFVVGILFLVLIYVGKSGIIPIWISGVFLITIGIFISSMLWKFFFKGGQ